ncbi:MAG: hypothetical protein EXR51_02570 [Dehalococcoidia bacterium]|nr:hypothetical protein [Dehalococcoidia bacterium]
MVLRFMGSYLRSRRAEGGGPLPGALGVSPKNKYPLLSGGGATERASTAGPMAQTWLPVALVTLLALLLRLHDLAYESLDVDEADLVAFARQDWGTLFSRLTQPGENGPLYVILLRLWIGVAGQSETALRLFSAIPATLCVPAIYFLGRRLFDHRSGLVCALLLACSSYQLFYAQMVKMYALVPLLALLSGWLLLEGIERPRWRTWVAYTAVTTALMFTHVFGAMVVPWHVIVALLNLRRRFLAPALVSLAVLTLPYLPLALPRLAALRAPETLTRQFTGPRELPGMFATLAREYGTRFDLVSLPMLDALFLGFTLLGLAALLATSRGRHDASGNGRLRNSFLVTGLAVPLLITFAFVSLGAPVFSSRYLIAVLPVFYLLWGAGISWTASWSRLPAVALLLLFIGLNAARWSESAFQGKRFREDWRGAVQRLRPVLGTGDQVVVLHDPSWRAVHYFAGEGWPLVSLEGGPERPADLSRLPAARPGGRIWLLAAWFEAPDLPPVEALLAERGRLESKEWENGVLVSGYRVE